MSDVVLWRFKHRASVSYSRLAGQYAVDYIDYIWVFAPVDPLGGHVTTLLLMLAQVKHPNRLFAEPSPGNLEP